MSGMHSWSFRNIRWKPCKSPLCTISKYVPKLTILQVFMENWYPFFGPFFCLNLTKMFSKLMFGHGKLIMRTYFTHVAITDQNWFYFFTPITLRIAHSALVSQLRREDLYLLLFSFGLMHQCLKGAIPSRKCSIKAHTKWRNSVHILT